MLLGRRRMELRYRLPKGDYDALVARAQSGPRVRGPTEGLPSGGILRRMTDSSFGFYIPCACLQLGVILCTIAAGAKKKVPWAVGVAIGVVGLAVLVNGFYRVVPAPESWYKGSGKQMGYQPPASHNQRHGG